MLGKVLDMPMKRILPSSRRATSSATESFCCSVLQAGLAWNWTASTWSVRMRRRLCSTPARTFSRVKVCSRNAVGAPSVATAHPHLEVRVNSSRRDEMDAPISSSERP